MQVYELIDDETKKKIGAKQPEPPRRAAKSKEKLSRRDIEELMGCNRQIHKRVNGKVKRK